MTNWKASAIKGAPIGAVSALTLTVVAVFCAVFRLLLLDSAASITRWFATALVIAAYLLFSPAVAASIYSLLFESRKLFGVVGLGAAGVALVMMLILADGLLMLPVWFLAILGVVKFFKWRINPRTT